MLNSSELFSIVSKSSVLFDTQEKGFEEMPTPKMPTIGSVPVLAGGYDNGNTDVCFSMKTNRGVQKRQFANVYADGDYQTVVRSAKAVGGKVDDTILPYGHYILEYGTGSNKVSKIIGEKVFADQLEPMTTHLLPDRYSNSTALEGLMVASADCLAPGIREYGLIVVTGVPITKHNDATIAAIEAALKGSHTFKLNNIERTMHVYDVTTVVEAAGALLHFGQAPRGQWQGVIDIGGGTTDLAVFDGSRPVYHYCASKKIGVGTAASQLKARFLAKYNRELPLHLAYRWLNQFVHQTVYTPQLRNLQGDFIPAQEINELIIPILRSVGNSIVEFVGQTWQEKILDMQKFIYPAGGGPYYFMKQLVTAFPFLKPVVDPEMGNAEGYRGLAERILATRHPSLVQQYTEAV